MGFRKKRGQIIIKRKYKDDMFSIVRHIYLRTNLDLLHMLVIVAADTMPATFATGRGTAEP